MSMQRYVSEELTHFVGRSYKSEYDAHEKQYRLLVRILKSGLLGKEKAAPLGPQEESDFSQNRFYKANVVCFSDIPVPDLGIHMGKFSRFGLAFNKSFLIQKGANPVFYVARNSRLGDPSGESETLAQCFDRNHARFWEFFSKAGDGKADSPDCGELESIRDFLVSHLFSFVKFYDEGLLPDDAENFYMEREWRVGGRLGFELTDVRRVIFPQRFARSFREDVPEYYGEITFS